MELRRLGKFLRNMVTKEEEKGEYSSGYWPAKIRKTVLDIISKKGKLLEVGCGEGLFLDALNKIAPDMELYGIDNWEEMLGKAEKRLKGKNVKLTLANGTKLPFLDNSFDTIICVNVLLNLPGLEVASKMLKEMSRVCNLDGSIVFEIRNKLSPLFKIQYKMAKYLDPDLKAPLSTYNIRDIRSLVKIKKIHYIGFPRNKLVPIMVIEAGK
ncbi:MAG: class I SAM-dependent methyltransferase [Candidatus Firestonebacteria bacterium]